MNAESDNVALRSSFGRISTCIAEIRRVANEMVGRQHKYQSVTIAFAREQGSNRDCRA